MIAEIKDITKQTLGGGFKYVLFSSLFGEDSHFDPYFSNGLKPPTSHGGSCGEFGFGGYTTRMIGDFVENQILPRKGYPDYLIKPLLGGSSQLVSG